MYLFGEVGPFTLEKHEAKVIGLREYRAARDNPNDKVSNEVYLLETEVFFPREVIGRLVNVELPDSPDNLTKKEIEIKYPIGQKIIIYLNPKNFEKTSLTRWLFPSFQLVWLALTLLIIYIEGIKRRD